jgi:hypothetical protein
MQSRIPKFSTSSRICCVTGVFPSRIRRYWRAPRFRQHGHRHRLNDDRMCPRHSIPNSKIRYSNHFQVQIRKKNCDLSKSGQMYQLAFATGNSSIIIATAWRHGIPHSSARPSLRYTVSSSVGVYDSSRAKLQSDHVDLSGPWPGAFEVQ